MKALFTLILLMFCSFPTFADNSVQNLAPRLQMTIANGLHDSHKVSATEPLDMIHQYLEIKYGTVDTQKFLLANDPSLYPLNEYKIGHINTYMTNLEIRKNLGRLRVNRNVIRSAEAIVWTIDGQGAFLGYEGMAKNGCGEPTPFLLVVDVKEKVVYGVDLNPCKK